jgi:hypothetical protein
LDDEFARFKIRTEIYKFSIHVYCGYEGEVVKKMTKYMMNNQNLTKEYSELKEKYSFSLICKDQVGRMNQALLKLLCKTCHLPSPST